MFCVKMIISPYNHHLFNLMFEDHQNIRTSEHHHIRTCCHLFNLMSEDFSTIMLTKTPTRDYARNTFGPVLGIIIIGIIIVLVLITVMVMKMG